MDIYLIKWESSDMIGGFYGDTLEQTFNTPEKLLQWSIEHALELRNLSLEEGCTLKYITREKLNKMRVERGQKPKPLFDEYLDEVMKRCPNVKIIDK
jgi:hypothetical protein